MAILGAIVLIGLAALIGWAEGAEATFRDVLEVLGKVLLFILAVVVAIAGLFFLVIR